MPIKPNHTTKEWESLVHPMLFDPIYGKSLVIEHSKDFENIPSVPAQGKDKAKWALQNIERLQKLEIAHRNAADQYADIWEKAESDDIKKAIAYWYHWHLEQANEVPDEIKFFEKAGGVSAPTHQPKPIFLTGNELGEHKDIKVLRQKAADYYRDHLQGKTVEHPELGKILFSGKGLKNIVSSSGNENKLKLIPSLYEIIKNGEYAGSEDLAHPRTDGIIKFHRINNAVSLDGKNYKVSVLIGEDEQHNKFYNFNEDVDAWKKKSLSTDGPRQSRVYGKASKSNIADNAEKVKAQYDVNLFIEG